MSSSKPFTYLIGWTRLNKFYYGVRYGINAHPETLWKTYFTSSNFVEKFRGEHGEPDLISIRRTFDDIMKARLWETKVLRRMKVVRRDDFLNMTDHPGLPLRLGTTHKAESIAKMRKPMAEERKKNISKAVRGKNQKRWLVKTPETEFCITSLDYLYEQGMDSLYVSFRLGRPMKRGRFKGWSLVQLQDVIL